VTMERPDQFEIVERDREINAIRERLRQLESEKAELEASLNRLLFAREARDSPPSVSDAPVTNASSPAAKIALFRSLFRGRDDVFPKRWENPKTGKAGYAPACANEWAPGICGKPKVKCGDCPHSAFQSATADVIDGHLRGYHTVGVYPLRLGVEAFEQGFCGEVVVSLAGGEHEAQRPAEAVAEHVDLGVKPPRERPSS